METFMSGLIRMSGRGILILLVVFFIRFLMKKLRVSHKYIMGLWAMAFFFFLFPWKISLPFGFWNHTDTAEEVRDVGNGLIQGDPEMENDMEGDMDSAVWDADPAEMAWKVPAQIPPKEDPSKEDSQTGQTGFFEAKDSGLEKSGIGILNVAGIVWLIGLCLLLSRLFYSYFALKKKLRVSVFYQDNIWWTEGTNIPMVFGLFHPQIYLPLFMQKEDTECVIAHENMHIKRKDALFKMLVYIVCLIHWLNPFVWIAYVLFAGDMEKACDEEVIRDMGKEQRKVYAYTLLRMAEESAAHRKKIFAAPVCFDEGDVDSRIKNIMKYKKTIRGLGIAAVVVIVGLCALFLTEAKEDGKEDQQETEQIGAGEGGGGTGNTAQEPEDTRPLEENQQTSEAEVPQDTAEEQGPISAEDTEIFYKQMGRYTFRFMSGSGGWSTDMHVYPDGSFEGMYYDSNMGDVGEGYYGSVNLCKFSGRFGELKKVDDLTYQTTIAEMQYENEPDTEAIIDGTLYYYKDAFGLEDAENILFYLPGTPTEKLSERCRSWIGISLYDREKDAQMEELPSAVLCNEIYEECFFGSDDVKTYLETLPDLRASVTKWLTVLEEETNERNRAFWAGNSFRSSDDSLNTLWELLKCVLPEKEMEQLTEEEKLWIEDKERQMEEAAAGVSDSAEAEVQRNVVGARLTMDRIEELKRLIEENE